MSAIIQIETHRLEDKIATAYAAALIKERKITDTNEAFDQAIIEGLEYAKDEIALDRQIESLKNSLT